MHKLFLLIGLVILLRSVLPSQSSAAETLPSTVEAIAQSRAWLKLLHYHRSFPFFTLKSELEGPGFFLSPDGRGNPEAELRADLAAFADPDRVVGSLKQPAQCAFPVRYGFLKSQLKLTIPDVVCQEYAAFLRRFNAHSATLVFSSAYPGSPASMFGHTFLRINAKQSQGESKIDLLDYGISYAAVVPPKENSFAYAYLGLTGGYPGQFSMEPYYKKVREYNNGESRDLWEYDLSLSEEETVRLVSHAWEIEVNSGFYYYFATENCSYQLLALLEAVRSDWDLTGHFIHVMPAETIKKIVAVPGAVTGVHLRPALRKKLLRGYESLTSGERDIFEQLVSHEREPGSVQVAPPLDVVIEYEHYLKESENGKLDEAGRDLLSQALLRRSQISPGLMKSEAAEIQADSRPENGHLPYRVGISGGAMSAGSGRQAALAFTDLNLKAAYHDLLNDDRGYSPFSQIDFPSLTLRYRPGDSRLNIERLLIGSLTSLNPFNRIDHKISWHAQADYYSAKDYGCIDCHLLRAEGAVGPTVSLFSRNAILTSFLAPYFEGGESLTERVRGGVRFELLAIVNPVASYKMLVSAKAVTDIFQASRPSLYYLLEWDHSLSLSPSYELRASWQRYLHGGQTPDYEEGKLTLNLYF